MNDTASFAQWLKEHRKSLDLTQEGLAERIGCSYDAVHKMEGGTRRPSRQVAELLADLFNVPAEEREAFIAFARGLDHETKPSGALPWKRPPGNLPAPLTRLIGRDKIVAALRGLLTQDAVRLLTLTGAPGIGKTRLSLQIAADTLDDFPAGVWFVELAALVEPQLVVSTIASALGLKEAGGTPIFETLKEHLKDKQLLIVVDNFEHVIDAANDLVQLLASGTGVKLLVTSRTPLRVRGEREYAVPPLSVPDLGHLPTLEELTQYESVRLFIERAQEVKADFAVNDDNASAVAEICMRLDGLPLAIELAAARVKMLPPHALSTRLSQRLQVLTGGARDLSARQQTLRGAIDWSYDLLDGGAKQLFARMAVFRGGRTLEALEAVCNYDGHLQLDVLDGVQSLLDKSLLQQREGSDGEPRFWMLETLHEYAREKLLGSGEEEELQRKHALYFMRLAEDAEPELVRKDQVQWMHRLDDEHDNITTALAWAAASTQAGNGDTSEREAVEIGLRTAGALWQFWDSRSYYTQGREAIQRLLAEAASLGCSRAVRAKALTIDAALAFRQLDLAGAREGSEQALRLCEAPADRRIMALSLINLGCVAWALDDHAAARPFLEESLRLFREEGDLWGIASVLDALGLFTDRDGDLATARSLMEESLALSREQGDKGGIARILSNLAELAYGQDDYVTAEALYREALVIAREVEFKMIEIADVAGLGELATKGGNPHTGAKLLGAASAFLESFGYVLEPEARRFFEDGVTTARAQLSEIEFERAWLEGQAMSLEQAIDYALVSE